MDAKDLKDILLKLFDGQARPDSDAEPRPSYHMIDGVAPIREMIGLDGTFLDDEHHKAMKEKLGVTENGFLIKLEQGEGAEPVAVFIPKVDEKAPDYSDTPYGKLLDNMQSFGRGGTDKACRISFSSTEGLKAFAEPVEGISQFFIADGPLFHLKKIEPERPKIKYELFK